MKSNFLAIASLFFAQVAATSAAIYTVNNGFPGSSNSFGVEDSLGRTFRAQTSAGTSFPAGGGVSAGPGSVAFGVFTSPAPAGLLTLNAAQLIAAFQEFGNSERNFSAGGPTGSRGLFSLSGLQLVTASIFSGNPIYLFAGNGTTLAASTEFLVLRSDTFVFNPVDDALPTPTTLSFTPANSTVIIGQVVPNVQTTNADSTTTPGWRMAVVPEPSTACLLLMAAIAMIRRRRHAVA